MKITETIIQSFIEIVVEPFKKLMEMLEELEEEEKKE